MHKSCALLTYLINFFYKVDIECEIIAVIGQRVKFIAERI